MVKRLRVLLVTPFLPYKAAPHAGGRFVAWVVGELSRSADVFLITRLSPDEAPFLAEAKTHFREVRVLEHRVPTATGGYFVERMLSYVRLGREATRWARSSRFDLILLEHVEAGVALQPPAGTRLLVDCVDVITKPAERRYRQSRGIAKGIAFLSYAALKALERRVVGRATLAIVRSEADRKYLSSLSEVPVCVVPHPAGLDLRGLERRPEGRNVLFLGALHRELNERGVLFFAREVLPLVRKRVPDVLFRVVGANPTTRIRSLHDPSSGIVIVGPVPEVEPAYLAAAVFVAPILVGGGIIVKILDAMAAGVPVVSTAYGNEGIGARDGEEILVANGAEEMAETVVSLLLDEGRNRRVGEAGRRFVQRTFGVDRVRSILTEVITPLR